VQFLLNKYSCGNFPQWNKRYRISAYHDTSGTHWFARRPATKYKNAGLRHVSMTLVSDRQLSSGHTAPRGAPPASRLAITGLLQRTPSLAQGSPCYVAVSSSIDIPILLNVSHCSNINHHKRCQDHSLTLLMLSSSDYFVRTANDMDLKYIKKGTTRCLHVHANIHENVHSSS
jgi:hypothetical protein